MNLSRENCIIFIASFVVYFDFELNSIVREQFLWDGTMGPDACVRCGAVQVFRAETTRMWNSFHIAWVSCAIFYFISSMEHFWVCKFMFRLSIFSLLFYFIFKRKRTSCMRTRECNTIRLWFLFYLRLTKHIIRTFYMSYSLNVSGCRNFCRLISNRSEMSVLTQSGTKWN